MRKLPVGWILGTLLVLTVVVVEVVGMAAASADVVVYKAPGCQCCERWADHLRLSGLKVAVQGATDLSSLKAKWGVPSDVSFCHTARIGNYTIEGHVPASAIQRLLKERPAIVGLAVAGMPPGSPGMEAGSVHQPYDVVAFDREGHVSVYESH